MAEKAGKLPFGTLLRRARLAAGLTQEELAERAGISRRGLGDLERGSAHKPHQDTVALLAEALVLAVEERAAFVAAARQGRRAPVHAVSDTSTASLPALVGRARELALLERHLAGEGPPVLLLAGEPGIGKSRLLHEARARAVADGWTVLAGGCQRGGGQDPYDPLPGTLEQRLRRATAAQARADLEGCAWLARLLPEVTELGAGLLPSWTVTPAQERRLVVRALERYLRAVAGPAGTLLVLDDVQWAGPDALDVLAALLERAEEIPLRLAAAYRSTEAPPDGALAGLVTGLLSDGRAVVQVLGPLVPEEASALLDELLAGQGAATAERDMVLRRAGGLPFFLVSCVQGLAAGGPAAIAETVAGSIRQRVAALPASAREVLRVAAVVGRVADRAVLLAAMEQPAEAVLEGLEAACRARLLEEEGAAAYRFAHDLVRDVVEGDLSAARRALLHQRVAEALEAGAGAQDVEALAFHYGQSDAQEKAIVYLEQAGDRAAATGANTAAERYYRELLNRLEAKGADRAVAHISARLGLLFERVSNVEQAFLAIQQAEAALARIRGAGERGSGSGLSDQRDDEPMAIEVYLARAALAISQDRYRDCKALALRAAAMARDAGDSALHADALRLLGQADFKSGYLPEALATLLEARALSERIGALAILHNVDSQIYYVHWLSGNFEEAARICSLLLENGERLGDSALIGQALFLRGSLAIDTGQWERGRADLERAARTVPYFANNLYVMSNLAWVSRLQGAWTEAGEILAQTSGHAERLQDINGLIMIERMRAELEIVQARPAAALARLRAALDREEVHDTAFMLPLVAWAHLRLGELEHADRVSVEAIERARSEHTLIALVDALRVRALVATALLQWDEAGQCLAEGLVLARRMPYPYAEALLLQASGEMLGQKGEPVAAREQCDAALAAFRHLGARKDAEQTEQLLAALG